MGLVATKPPRERDPGPYPAGRKCEQCGAGLSRNNPSPQCAPCSPTRSWDSADVIDALAKARSSKQRMEIAQRFEELAA